MSKKAVNGRRSPGRLTIGALAKRLNVSTSMLRFYEREGLLVPEQRFAQEPRARLLREALLGDEQPLPLVEAQHRGRHVEPLGERPDRQAPRGPPAVHGLF